MSEDDCSSCEGWDELDADGNCAGCAHEIATDPKAVIDRHTGEVLARGLASDHAELIKRVRQPHPYSDGPRARVSPQIVREADLRPTCGHVDLGRPCSVCAAFAAAPSDEAF